MRGDHPRAGILLGIGSAQESHTLLNPFTASERFEMIHRALAAENVAGVTPVPIADIQRHAVWVAHVRSLLPPFEIVYTNNPLTRLLFEEAGYEVKTPPLVDRTRFEGSRIRLDIAAGKPFQELVPVTVAEYLTEIRGAERIRLLASRGPDVTPEHA